MTREEYLKVKAAIDQRYRDDVAALERVYAITNGVAPPDTVIAPAEEVAQTKAGARAALDQKEIDAKKAARAAYARAYYLRKKNKDK